MPYSEVWSVCLVLHRSLLIAGNTDLGKSKNSETFSVFEHHKLASICAFTRLLGRST